MMLQIKDLYKVYGKYTAVNSLQLEVSQGEIFGFVGPNGAGKTTTMRIICGLLSATSGEVYIDGIDAINNSRKVKDIIGYMPDFFGVYDNLKVSEYLDFYASIYNIVGKEKDKICGDLLELVDLSSKKDSYVDTLSRGMKQRLCLARSLVHNPKLLILDEPASGMDPRARYEMKEILKTLKDMDKTIIISSHILPELAELCTSIGIIESGKIVIQGTVDEIMRKVYKNKSFKLRVRDKLESAVMLLKEMSSVDKITTGDNSLEAYFQGGDEEMCTILTKLVEAKIPVISFAEMDGNLEDVFMKVTAKNEE